MTKKTDLNKLSRPLPVTKKIKRKRNISGNKDKNKDNGNVNIAKKKRKIAPLIQKKDSQSTVTSHENTTVQSSNQIASSNSTPVANTILTQESEQKSNMNTQDFADTASVLSDSQDSQGEETLSQAEETLSQKKIPPISQKKDLPPKLTTDKKKTTSTDQKNIKGSQSKSKSKSKTPQSKSKTPHTQGNPIPQQKPFIPNPLSWTKEEDKILLEIFENLNTKIDLLKTDTKIGEKDIGFIIAKLKNVKIKGADTNKIQVIKKILDRLEKDDTQKTKTSDLQKLKTEIEEKSTKLGKKK